MESENKLVFVVDMKATKQIIKSEIEKMFKVKVVSVHTLIDRDAKKRAFVKFSKENPAIDVATSLGLM